jgi:hypothetical protein
MVAQALACDEVLTVSRDTVKRDWNFAKLRRAREIRGQIALDP